MVRVIALTLLLVTKTRHAKRTWVFVLLTMTFYHLYVDFYIKMVKNLGKLTDRTIKMSNIKQRFIYFLMANLLLWSIVPLLRESLPMDTQEALMWGKYCFLGTTKHPPFSGWLAYGFWDLLTQWDGAMYLLSQLCVLLGVFYIFRLAKEFVGQTKAVLAALLQFGIIFYNFSSVEYNVNVVSLALWPMCAFYFWRGYTQNKLSDWLLFGIFAGVNLLNKYVSGLLLVAIGLFILLHPKTLKNYRLYIAGFIALAIVAPHLWWLWQNDFAPFEYLSHRSEQGKFTSQWRHLAYPLKFIGAQILFSAAAWLTYLVLYKINKKEKFVGDKEKSQFLLIVGLLPLLTWFLIGIITGSTLKSMWGFPCLFLLGTMLFYFFPIQIGEKQILQVFRTMAVWTVVFAIAYAAQIILTKSERFHSDCRQIARQMTRIWKAETGGKPLEYVGGNEWFTNMTAIYGEDKPKPMIWLNPKANSWFDANDFASKGALVVASNAGEYAVYQKAHEGKVSPARILPLTYKNYLGKTKTKNMFYGFYNLKEAANAQE